MYRLCFSETFNVCFFRSAGRLSNRSGVAAISFDGCLLFHFRYSVVDSAMRARYSIAYRTLVRQVILTYCSRKSGCRFRQPTLQKLSLINMGFSDSSKNLNICCSSLRSVCQQSVIRQQRRVQDGFDTHSHTGAGCNYLSGICTVATVIIALCFCDVAHLVDQRHKVRMSCNIACASTMRSRRRPFSMRCAAATAI